MDLQVYIYMLYLLHWLEESNHLKDEHGSFAEYLSLGELKRLSKEEEEREKEREDESIELN